MTDIDGTTTALFDQLNAERALADDLAADFAYAAETLSREFDLYNIDTGSLARYREARRL